MFNVSQWPFDTMIFWIKTYHQKIWVSRKRYSCFVHAWKKKCCKNAHLAFDNSIEQEARGNTKSELDVEKRSEVQTFKKFNL